MSEFYGEDKDYYRCDCCNELISNIWLYAGYELCDDCYEKFTDYAYSNREELLEGALHNGDISTEDIVE